ncbi:hypothetical protein QBZ16_000268 [Prototheca wickerhamii]|uniref:non-specific serine/threonine protein kinase n=1 Tax=Prototheca wickerhamii TaxID=3111 RepID=A0AAD9MLY9_PROWI|nr:hypothetical protein QBZ16_000268 [Prototheca wickerhamii]
MSQGQRLGDYIIGQTIGQQGADSRVVVAQHIATGERVAMKILDKEALLAGGGATRFPREVAALRRLSHPCTVRLISVLASKASLFMVMELVPGGDLYDRIAHEGALPELEARRLFCQLLSAVSACHAVGVFHRDIKPENVLLTRQGDAKLADFGLGALADGDALLDTACGTLHYAAPRGGAARAVRRGPADIWSLGVVLYAMLAGRLPFEEEHNAALVARIAAAAYEPLPAQVSAEAVQVVGAMLQVDPAARPSAETIWEHALATEGLHSAVDTAERLDAQIESVVSPRTAAPSKAPSAFALLRSSFDISGMFDPDRAAPVLRRTRFTAASDLLPHIRREVQSAGGRAVETAGNGVPRSGRVSVGLDSGPGPSPRPGMGLGGQAGKFLSGGSGAVVASLSASRQASAARLAMGLGPADAHHLEGRGRRAPPLLDKLVTALGRQGPLWRRALDLLPWLLATGHPLDDRLCTSVLRLAAQRGDLPSALRVYAWMRAPREAGGAGLSPSAADPGCAVDCRLATVHLEACARTGDVATARAVYAALLAAPAGSPLAPSAHALAAALRALPAGEEALRVWADMEARHCQPSAHVYAAAVTASGGDWRRAWDLFSRMRRGTAPEARPDVVACTAVIGALARAGEAARAREVLAWMHGAGVEPNARTFTALLAAHANAGEWACALRLLRDLHAHGGARANAYTYSALLKAAAEQGAVDAAEEVFGALEAQLRFDAAKRAARGGLARRAGAARDAEAERADAAAGALAVAIAALALPPSRSASPPAGVSDIGVADADAHAPLATAEGSEQSRLDNDDDPVRRLLCVQLGAALGGVDDGSGDEDPELEARRGAAAAAVAAWAQPATSSTIAQSYPTPLPNETQPDDNNWSPSPINEVVCGAMMAVYERAGLPDRAVALFDRAPALGVRPNGVMLNAALSALGKAGRGEEAAALVARSGVRPDLATYELLIAGWAAAGRPAEAEAVLRALRAAGLAASQSAYAGLAQAYRRVGDALGALGIKERMREDGLTPGTAVLQAIQGAVANAEAACVEAACAPS